MENSVEKDSRDSTDSQLSSPIGPVINAPKFGIVIPNRVFVGGISAQTTENDLAQLFSSYGNVTNTKIIADRAGVSKGYGFVTFETDEEAKRLQNDADSIVLRDRRLNIAPAIRKQMYPRPYDGLQPVPGSPVSIAPGQFFRQSGIPIFQNGMAFYSAAPVTQPPPQITPVQSPVENSQVYQAGAYGGIPQNTSQPLAFSYPSQNHFYYQAHCPYQIACGPGYAGYPEDVQGQIQPAYLEGYPISEAQLASNNVLLPTGGVDSGGVIFAASPYFIAPQPTSQVNNYFEPQNLSPIAAPTSQEQMTPVFYSPPRGYETPAPGFVYAECKTSIPGPPPSGTQQNGQEGTPHPPKHVSSAPSLHTPQEPRTDVRSQPNFKLRGKNYAPRYDNGKYHIPRQFLNNNDPNFANRNPALVRKPMPKMYPPRSVKPSSSSHRTFPSQPLTNKSFHPHINSHNRSSPPQVPQFPYIPGVRPPFLVQPITQHYSSPRRGMPRPKHNGRGKPAKPGGWFKDNGENVPEEGVLANALTPPITPRSPHDAADELPSSLQSLNI